MTEIHSSSSPNVVTSHNEFKFDNVVFSSNFDNGNLANVERAGNYSYKVWSAPDNYKTPHQTKNSFWFYFSVSGLESGARLCIRLVNAAQHGTLYKHDMRPVFKSYATNNTWIRLRKSTRIEKEGDLTQIVFDHVVEAFPSNDNNGHGHNGLSHSHLDLSVVNNNLNKNIIYFAFTYPFTYTMLMNDLEHLTHWKVRSFVHSFILILCIVTYIYIDIDIVSYPYIIIYRIYILLLHKHFTLIFNVLLILMYVSVICMYVYTMCSIEHAT